MFIRVRRSHREPAERRAVAAASGCESSIQRGNIAQKPCCKRSRCCANGSRLRVVTADWWWLLWRGLARAEYGDWDIARGQDRLARHFRGRKAVSTRV